MAAATDYYALDQYDLFRGLAPAQLVRLRLMICRKTLPAAATIYTRQQPNHAIYFMAKGTVKLFVENHDGTQVIIAILGPGTSFGAASIVDDLGHLTSAATLEVSTLLCLDRATFQECLLTMPRLALNLNHVLAQRLRSTVDQIQSLAKQDVEARLARQILAFAGQYTTDQYPALDKTSTIIPIRLTQTDLANLIGASRVRVNQVLTTYKRSNYISIDQRHRITIHNYAALARRCQ